MKPTTYMDEEELVRKAVEVLIDQLGPVETVRFLGLRRRRRIDAVARHREWQKNLDPERFLA